MASQKDVMALIGLLVVTTQITEGMLKLCITFVLPREEAMTVDALLRQEAEERKKTLGYILGEIRKRADLDEDFDALLNDFLEHRNQLIHRIDDVPGISFVTADGLKVAWAFLTRLHDENQRVLNVFAGLVRAWQQKNGIEDAAGTEKFMAMLDEKYVPLVDDIFFKKDGG